MRKMNRILAASMLLTTIVSPISAFAATNSNGNSVETTTSSSVGFSDTNGAASWAKDDILKAQSLGLMSGDPDGKFRPLDKITRQEVASILVRNLKLDVQTVSVSSFSDVSSSDWGLAYIEAVKKAGIMLGDGNGTFRPNDPISREELATILVKTADVNVQGKGANLKVADKDLISDWAKDYVDAAIETGLMLGDGVNFDPKKSAQRQEVAVVFVRYATAQSVTTKQYTGDEAKAFVQPQDFAVEVDDSQGIRGYNVGFALQGGKTAADVNNVEVSLYKDNTLLQTNTSDKVLTNYSTATQLSTPFDVDGSYHDTDSSWKYGTWQGNATDVPTKAVIKVTDKAGNVYVVENDTLAGNTADLTAPITGDEAKAFVQPQDFAVDVDDTQGIHGYNVGFALQGGKTAADVKSVEVSLYKDNTLLQTNTSDKVLTNYSTATQLSTPFDVKGNFKDTDGSWNYGTWQGNASDVPTKAVIKVTDKDGNVYVVENDTLTGNSADLTVQ